MDTYDVVIIGGGMAGLSAALYGGWLGRKVFLAERQMFGGQIVNADRIENYPGFPEGILGADLVAQMRTQALKLGAKMQYLEITGIEFDGGGFRLTTAEEPVKAKTVIVATGGKHRALGVKGEAELEGRGVSYCATCDGAFFQNQPVAVIGGGDSIEGLRLTNGTILTVAGLFIAVGFQPETSLLAELLQLDPMGHAPVDIHMQTTVAGLFAIGSARQGNAGQLASAAGDGVTAAMAARRFIDGF